MIRFVFVQQNGEWSQIHCHTIKCKLTNANSQPKPQEKPSVNHVNTCIVIATNISLLVTAIQDFGCLTNNSNGIKCLSLATDAIAAKDASQQSPANGNRINCPSYSNIHCQSPYIYGAPKASATSAINTIIIFVIIVYRLNDQPNNKRAKCKNDAVRRLTPHRSHNNDNNKHINSSHPCCSRINFNEYFVPYIDTIHSQPITLIISLTHNMRTMRTMLTAGDIFDEMTQGSYKYEWLNFNSNRLCVGSGTSIAVHRQSECLLIDGGNSSSRSNREWPTTVMRAMTATSLPSTAKRIVATYVLNNTNSTAITSSSSSTTKTNIDTDNNIGNTNDNKDNNNHRADGTNAAIVAKPFYTLQCNNTTASTAATTSTNAKFTSLTTADEPALFDHCINLNDDTRMSYLKNLGAECSNKTNTLKMKMMIDNDCNDVDCANNRADGGSDGAHTKQPRLRSTTSFTPTMLGIQHIRNAAVFLLLIISSFPVFCSGEFFFISNNSYLTNTSNLISNIF